MPINEEFQAFKKDLESELKGQMTALANEHGAHYVLPAGLLADIAVALRAISDSAPFVSTFVLDTVEERAVQLVCLLCVAAQLDPGKVFAVNKIIRGYQKTITEELTAKAHEPPTQEQSNGTAAK